MLYNLILIMVDFTLMNELLRLDGPAICSAAPFLPRQYPLLKPKASNRPFATATQLVRCPPLPSAEQRRGC
jgi:hypothetical protein